MAVPNAVVALLTDDLFTLLGEAVGDLYRLYPSRDVTHLDVLLTLYPLSVAVVDPQHPALGDPAHLLAPLERHPSAPGVAYTTLSSVGMRSFGALAYGGMRHLILHGVDDSPDRIRNVIEEAPSDTYSEILVRLSEPLFSRLPPTIARAVRHVFLRPKMGNDVDDLALAAGVSRRTLDRTLERCNIAPGGTLLRAARVIRAYYFLQGRRTSLPSIAARLGYLTHRGLTSEIALMTGVVPSLLANAFEPHQFLSFMAERLYRHGKQHDHYDPAAVSAEDLAMDAPDWSHFTRDER